MSAHLPECLLATACKHDYYDEPPIQCADCGEECICDRLRACEQRVRLEDREAIEKAADGVQWAYAAGVQAARDAVAALDACPECSVDATLAAIDALREQP